MEIRCRSHGHSIAAILVGALVVHDGEHVIERGDSKTDLLTINGLALYTGPMGLEFDGAFVERAFFSAAASFTRI